MTTTPLRDWTGDLPDDPEARANVARRLASKLHGEGDCLVFVGSRTPDGYGNFHVSREHHSSRAHRVAFELAHGPIPPGLVVMHTCDNPPCCYIDHLRLGTVADNNADRAAKGRTKGLVIGIAADLQRAKTHCPQRHPYSGDNVRYRADGRRRCAHCYREAAAKRRAAQKASA